MGIRVFGTLACLLAMLMIGCENENSPPVTAEDYFVEYSLMYNAGLDKTFAQAVFKETDAYGDRIRLTSSAVLEFNGEPLSYDRRYTQYLLELDGSVETGSFKYVDQKGSSFENSISVMPASLTASFDTVDVTSDLELDWEGETLNADEKVTLRFSLPDNTLSYDFDYEEGQSINVPSDILKIIESNPAYNLYLYRYNRPPIQQANKVGGTIAGIYESRRMWINVKK